MRARAAALAALAALACLGAGRPHEEVLRRTGGLVSREGRGRLVLVNLQGRIPEAALRAKAEYLSRLLGIRAEVTADASARGAVTVRVTDGMARAAEGFDAAFAREAARLFVPEGRRTRCTRDEVEALFRGDSFTLAARDEVRRLLPEAGFEPAVVATYQTACREGWAPAPTNGWQRAIWERALSEKERGPTNPILILPPNRKK